MSSFEGGSGGSVNRHMVSSVVLIAANQESPVFFSASSVDDELKSLLVTEINMFLADKNQTDHTGTFAMRTMFGWLGLPFAAIGLFGLLRWPYTVLEKWNEHKRSLR
ncbi:MAG: hypothetical protein NZQ09_05855 [Chloroflexus sp.]|nr:hypothetical protein [Chloroflexus sp.]